MKKYKQAELEEFLEESNAIEGEYSDEALEEAMEAWQFLIGRDSITIPGILQMHKILMKTRDLKEKYKGVLRDCPVYIGGREAMDHREIRAALKDWCRQTNADNPDWEALHISYERIHPFVDGNGRTGRHLMNWTRLKKCDLPLWIIHEGLEQMEYYKMFR